MNNSNRCWSYRIRLEKLKQQTVKLVIISRLLFLLALIVSYCLRRA